MGFILLRLFGCHLKITTMIPAYDHIVAAVQKKYLVQHMLARYDAFGKQGIVYGKS